MTTNLKSQPIYSFAKLIVATHEQVQVRISELARRIAEDYRQVGVSRDSPLVLICVLKGAFIFAADLCRALSAEHVPTVVEFLCVTSYAGGTTSSGEVRMLLDLRTGITNRHCLIVEDIIDTAQTMRFLMNMLGARNPASLKSVALLDKPHSRKIPMDANYRGFVISNEFVVGYGLDYEEQYRDLKDIIVLKPEVYTKVRGTKEKKSKL